MATIVVEQGERIDIIVQGSETAFAVYADTEEHPGAIVVTQTSGANLEDDEEEPVLFEDSDYDPESDEDDEEEESESEDDSEEESDGDAHVPTENN